MKTSCVVCGADNPPGRPGRPRKVCSEACRRENLLNTRRIHQGRPLTNVERQARHKARHPRAMSVYKRRYNLKCKGLTLEAFAELLQLQGGRCALCEHEHVAGHARKSLVVDHDHSTGAVRGLLCHSCNRAIGLMHDDAQRLRFAAQYLEIYATSTLPT